MTVAVTPGVQRRAEITDAIRRETGIDEAMIERLVRGFYRRVREDALIGPVFAARIGDWEPHLARMCAFWSSVALMTGSYHGQPMQKHLPLPVDAILIVPGCAFASAMNCATLVTGTDGWSTMTRGSRVMPATGAMSRRKLKPRLG